MDPRAGWLSTEERLASADERSRPAGSGSDRGRCAQRLRWDRVGNGGADQRRYAVGSRLEVVRRVRVDRQDEVGVGGGIVGAHVALRGGELSPVAELGDLDE